MCVKDGGKIEQTRGMESEKVVVVVGGGEVVFSPDPGKGPAGHAEVRRLERRTQGRQRGREGCVSLNRSPHSQPSGK